MGYIDILTAEVVDVVVNIVIQNIRTSSPSSGNG